MSDNREILRTTSLKGMVPAQVQNRDATDTYQAMIAEIQRRCGVEVASLFSEPVRPSKPDPANPQMTWFTQLDGQMLDLNMIDEVARRPVTSLLRRRLEQLKPVLDDPEIGPTVASWLNITSTTDLLSVGGNPVLINWGYLPEEVARSGIRREVHFTETVGRYAPELQRPPFTAEEAAAAADYLRGRPSAPIMPSLGVPTVSPLPAQAAAAAPEAPPPAPRHFPPGLLTPLIASAVAAAILAILLIPGVLILPGNEAAHSAPQRQSGDRENAALEERARQLEQQARERVCRPPSGQLGQITPLPGQAQPANPTPRTDTPRGGRTQAPSHDAAPAASLNTLLDNNAVLVIGSTDDGRSKVGSGFFITNDRIVTSRRVVLGLSPNSIQVTNKMLGQALSVQLLALSAPPNSPDSADTTDFALLGVNAPPRIALPIGPSPQRSTNVLSVGYPQSAIQADADFQAFADGNGRAAPASIRQPGIIVDRADGGPVKYVTHSAFLEVGSSGGPLIDYCGRVVGVNTLVRGGAGSSAVENRAQDVSELRAFLQYNGVTPLIDDEQKLCSTPLPGPTTRPGQPPAPNAPDGRK